MEKIKYVIEYISNNSETDEETFKIFSSKEPILAFLGSPLVSDFITIMKCFGYKIEEP